MARHASRLLVVLAMMIAGAGSVRAAELLMFEEAGCVWCAKWHAEIGPSYHLTDEGRQAPLRRLHIHAQGQAGATLARPVTGTPTFVLIEDGREYGRIVGYPGSDFFYPLLEELLQRLPAARPPEPRPSLRTIRAEVLP